MDLHSIIQSTLSSPPAPARVREAISLLHRIAITYMRRKVASGGLDPQRFGLSLEDMALDCIADLFKRDETGVFTTLKLYFETLDWGPYSEGELVGACRRLVCSKVNQELYRQYKEHDPDLHKIIRNIKDTIPRIPVVRLEERDGENTLVFGGSDIHLPVISPEILESYLTDAISTQLTIRGILLAAAQVFADQEVYRRSYPLTGFALLVRAAFANLEVSVCESAVENTRLTENELRRFISKSVNRTSDRMMKGYVGKGKVTEEIYSTYFETIGEILHTEFVRSDGDIDSYYEHLIKQVPGLTKDEYCSKHRTMLEYLTKLTRGDFLERVRKELEE